MIKKTLSLVFISLVLMGCTAVNNQQPTKPASPNYTPIQYWNCATRHQGKDEASQKALEDCLDLYRKIDQTQSN